ncbi:MAG: gfo/Idh/MocA family oxidoreductase, partial [Pseudomonadota bacterium]
ARAGEAISVTTPTTLHALLTFDAGAVITLSASWDVTAHRHGHMELYGTKGTLFLPDPNFFGGALELGTEDGIAPLAAWDHPFGRPNEERDSPRANYRTAGLAEMVAALREDRPHRCALDFAVHCVEVMTSILRAAESGERVDLQTRCVRPAPLGPDAAAALLREG